jgi:hypothetical protein
VRKWIALVAATALLAAMAAAFVPATALADTTGGGTCTQVDPTTGSCLVWSGGGGGGGGDGGGTGSVGGGNTGGGGNTSVASNTCHWDTSNGHEPGVVPCSAGGGVWTGFCYLSFENPQPPQGFEQWQGHTTGAIYVCSAPGPGESGIGIIGLEFWFATPPAGLGPSPAQVAQEAYAEIVFPHPTGDRSPSQTLLYKGYSFTYVGLWTYYWTSPDTWKPLTASVTDEGVTATVTATPAELDFDPGDGHDVLPCAGPGRPWTSADGNSAPAAGACGYRYEQVTSSPITSTQTIVWRITWTGTGDSSGQIPSLSTSTTGELNVMQIQTVVTR